MGKIIGNKKMPVISYSQEEVKEITNELNAKIVELTETNVKLSEERDILTETNVELNAKIVELTEALEKKNKKDSDKESK
jgi:hypothetical protein